MTITTMMATVVALLTHHSPTLKSNQFLSHQSKRNVIIFFLTHKDDTDAKAFTVHDNI